MLNARRGLGAAVDETPTVGSKSGQEKVCANVSPAGAQTVTLDRFARSACRQRAASLHVRRGVRSSVSRIATASSLVMWTLTKCASVQHTPRVGHVRQILSRVLVIELDVRLIRGFDALQTRERFAAL